MMRWMVRTSLIAVATSFPATVGASAQNNSPDMSGWAQHWAATSGAAERQTGGPEGRPAACPRSGETVGAVRSRCPRCACDICRR